MRGMHFTITWFLILSLPLTVAAAGQTKWSAIAPGLELADGSLTNKDQRVTFIMVRCDPKRNRVRIIDTFHELRKANSFAAFSVREVRNKTGASIVVNAGSTASYSLPAPVGLLQIGGNIRSKPNQLAEHAGVLCLAGDQIFILPLSTVNSTRCLDAVQRGPFLSQDSLRVSDPSSKRYRRTVVAVDSVGRLLILVTREATELSAIVSYLFVSNSDLHIQSALNLDGDVSSGIVFARDDSLQTVGNVDGLVASAIAIYGSH
jgi:uncharacterized protein YigE (DUF2233 family)